MRQRRVLNDKGVEIFQGWGCWFLKIFKLIVKIVFLKNKSYYNKYKCNLSASFNKISSFPFLGMLTQDFKFSFFRDADTRFQFLGDRLIQNGAELGRLQNF